MRYEKFINLAQGQTEKPANDRVGCRDCGDLRWLMARQWALLVSHKDDYFVRTDNPVFLTGFVERAQTCLLYPLSPRVCFLAKPLPSEWRAGAFVRRMRNVVVHELGKGDAHLINFSLAKSADCSLVVCPEHDDEFARLMFEEILGKYPQPPFLLHIPESTDFEDEIESIRMTMSLADKKTYPPYHPAEIENAFANWAA